MDFIHQASVEALLQNAGGGYDNILVVSGLLCLTNGAFNSIGDKGKRRSFLDPFLSVCVCSPLVQFCLFKPSISHVKVVLPLFSIRRFLPVGSDGVSVFADLAFVSLPKVR